MVADTYDLRESCNCLIDALRQQHQPVCTGLHILLQKAVKATAAETAGPEIVLGYYIVILNRCVGNHDNLIPNIKCSGRIVYNAPYAFMDQRHGKFFAQNLLRSRALIIALVSITDRQMRRSDYDMFIIKSYILKTDLKLSWSLQLINGI